MPLTDREFPKVLIFATCGAAAKSDALAPMQSRDERCTTLGAGVNVLLGWSIIIPRMSVHATTYPVIRREDANMKSWLAFGLCAVGMGVLVSTVEQGYADENDRATKCTTATLKGRYLFAGTGTRLPPAVEEPTPTASAGYHIFNGDGTGTDFVTFVINGNVVPVPSPTPVMYTLNSDCTGTLTVENGPHLDIFVSPNGEELATINTDPGVVNVDGPSRRAGPK
jgi:hypothetical protein